MDNQLMTRLRELPRGSEEQKKILALLDCHFMSTAMLRITETPAEQRVILEKQIIEILDHRRQPTV